MRLVEKKIAGRKKLLAKLKATRHQEVQEQKAETMLTPEELFEYGKSEAVQEIREFLYSMLFFSWVFYCEWDP